MKRVDPALTVRVDHARLPADVLHAAKALPTATLHEAARR